MISPARRAAIAAIFAAVLTGAIAATLGGGDVHLYGAFVYVALAGISISAPRAITAQVIAGQLLAAGALIGPGGVGLLAIMPVIAGVIVTTELLGIVARLDSPLHGTRAFEVRRAGVAAIVGAGVFACVAVLAEVEGPAGFVAVAIAAGGVFGVGRWVVGAVADAGRP